MRLIQCYTICQQNDKLANQGKTKMKTEIPKHFTHGFILTEQDLWSINDDIDQQMRRETKDEIISFFEVKYKSGVKAEKASLSEVISENNSGEWEIQALKMGSFSKSRPQRPKIEIEFRVPPPPVNRDNTKAPYSIYYYILGDERDWVYLTSSKLDDRIARIKRLPLDLYGMAVILILYRLLCTDEFSHLQVVDRLHSEHSYTSQIS
jgi:hypothetical protein